MAKGMNLSADDRGISATVIVVLLIGITLVGVIAIISVGLVTISDTTEQANMAVAEESMLQIDSTFQQSSGSNATVTIPSDVEGQVSVSNDAQYKLTLNDNPTCSTGPQALSSIQYEGNGDIVSYEGGGVWRMTESGATMTSPPDITYNDGSLSLSFVQVNGSISAGETIQATSNASRQRNDQRTLALALYSDLTYEELTDPDMPSDTYDIVCQPSSVESATLQIRNSEYARAWADWARENYDDRRVSTPHPSGTVEPGDTVEIRFELGDVSEPYFNVSDVSYSRSDAANPLSVTATVTNTGGLTGTQQVVVYNNTTQSDDTRLTLSEDEQRTLAFEVDGEDLRGGVNELTVSGSNNVTRYIYVTPGPSPEDATSEMALTIEESISNTVAPGTQADGEVRVRNDGDLTATERVTLTVGGDLVQTWLVTLDGGESETLDIGAQLPTNESVTDQSIEITGDLSGDTVSSRYTVATRQFFRISDDDIYSPSSPNPTPGDTLTVEADITNTGNQTATDDVHIRLVGGTTDHYEQRVTLDPDESTPSPVSVNFATDSTEPDEYIYFINTSDENVTGSIYVGPESVPNFDINGTSVPDGVQLMDTEIAVNVTVDNIGTEDGSQDLVVEHIGNDTVLNTTQLNIASGASETTNFTVQLNSSVFTTGFNTIGFRTNNSSRTSTVRVSDAATTGVSGGSGDSDGGDTITINRGVRAQVTLEGAELEGINLDYGWIYNGYRWEWRVTSADYTTVAPVTIRQVIENESGRHVELLWDDYYGGDVNDPRAERRLTDSDYENVYTRTVNLSAGSNTSLYATSRYCDGSRPSGVTHDSLDWYGDTSFDDVPAYECSNPGSERINISSESNSGNVVIRADGEQLPTVDEAEPYQIGVNEMLDGQINESGYVDLADDEYVFLYELSYPNADYTMASGSGDPDYNDAVTRFQVLNLYDTITVASPPTFEMSVDHPERIDRGDDAALEVNVTNVGGSTGSTDIEALFQGESDQNFDADVTDLASGDSTTVTFELETDSLNENESYDWQVDATANSSVASEAAGNIYVGRSVSPNVQITEVNAPLTRDNDTARSTVDISVQNIGGASISDPAVSMDVYDSTGNLLYDNSTDANSLSRDGTDTVTFNLPISRGDYTYEVSTADDTSTTRPHFVGYSDVEVVRNDEGINIGTGYYDPGTRITRDGRIGAMNIRLQNDGTIGDNRRVNLNITNSDDIVAFDESNTPSFGSGDIRNIGSYPNTTVFTFRESDTPFSDSGLPSGFYTYNITVWDTSGTADPTDDRLDDTITGEIYLRNVSTEVSNSEDSPVNVESSTITVSD